MRFKSVSSALFPTAVNENPLLGYKFKPYTIPPGTLLALPSVQSIDTV